MAIVDGARPASAQEELDALIKEARERQRRRRRRGAFASLALLILAGAVAAAFGDSGTGGGHPVPLSPEPVGIAARAADPAGGLPWGIRMVRGASGETCVQLGRLRGSTLGVIGQDGAFANDGRFHALPPSSAISARCAPTGATRRAFLNILDWGQPASGLVLATDGSDLKKCGSTTCPEHDVRLVQFGLLGPDAASATYKLVDRLYTNPTGPDGAYLIVADPTRRLCVPLVGAATCGSGTAEFNAPNQLAGIITRVRYRSGQSTTDRPVARRAPGP